MKKNKTIDINEFAIKKFIEDIRPKNKEIRAEIDFGYSYDGKTIELFEIRPVWNDETKIQNLPFAKIRFYKSRQLWKLYWMRASGKWELYQPLSESTYLDKIIKEIKEDKHACFFG